MTVPGQTDTGSDYYGGQAQQPAPGYDPTAGYQQPAPAVPEYREPSYADVMAKPRGGGMGGVGRLIVLVLVIIGIIILMTAQIYAASLIKLDSDDFDDYEEYRDKVESISYNSSVLMSVANALIPLGLLIAAIVMEDLGPATRSGLAIAAGIVLAFSTFYSALSAA